MKKIFIIPVNEISLEEAKNSITELMKEWDGKILKGDNKECKPNENK